MTRRHTRTLCLILLPLALLACSKKAEVAPAGALSKPVAMSAAAPAADMARAAPEQAEQAEGEQSQRFIALRHELLMLTEPQAVETAWKAAQEACAAAACDLLSSSISHEDDQQPASGHLDARVPPARLKVFMDKVTGLGTVGQHSTSAEDKTDQVVDTEARLKNMAEFRDHLRKMLATPGAKLSELIEVERELTRVQSELDSLATQRKVLAQETEKVRVLITFQARSAILQPGVWSPVKQAFQHAGHVFAGSIASLISFVAAMSPWLVVALPLAWGLKAWWRRSKAAKAA